MRAKRKAPGLSFAAALLAVAVLRGGFAAGAAGDGSPGPVDAEGNPLPPLPPALRDDPGLLDPHYVERYLAPGVFGLRIRIGFGLCADFLGDGARGCAARRPLGGGADGAVLAHLFELWKLSFAAGLRGGWRFDPAPLAAPERSAGTQLLTLGALLHVEGDAGDWVFGADAVPIGLAQRFSDGAASGRTDATDAYFDAGLFLGWRAWGHVPVGAYASFTGAMALPGAGPFPPGAVLVGVFAGRRFGDGRTAFGED